VNARKKAGGKIKIIRPDGTVQTSRHAPAADDWFGYYG
jgi:hypothetical protein